MKYRFRIGLLGFVFLFLFLIDLCIDNVIITPFAFLHNEEDRYILINIRLPRVFTAFLTGGIMGMCGTVMQTITRNPLASPYTLGISAGAGLGAALAAFGIGIFAYLGIDLSAFIGAIGASFPILIITKRQSSGFKLVLTGVAISSLCNAGISIAQYYATPDQVYQYIFWAMGDLQRSTWRSIIKLVVVSLIGSAIFLFKSRDLDILSMGKDDAQSLGISVEKLTLLLLFVVSIQTAISVSIVGIIGFVGLVAPHIARHFLKEENKFVLLGSVFISASLLIAADFISRYFTYPVRFPIGAITAIFGVPFFLWIIHKRSISND
jgi:iron complex transport system permease protein